MTTGRGGVRPETILYELGTHIQTLLAHGRKAADPAPRDRRDRHRGS